MELRALRHVRSWGALGIVAFALSGCHIHNSMPATSASGSPSGNPTENANGLPSTDATTQFSVSSGGGNLPISSQGVGGTLTYLANNAVSVTGTYTLTTNPPTSVPAISGTPLIYFEVQFGSNVTFNAPFYISPVVFPSDLSLAGITFTETLYDEPSGLPIGSPATGVVNGQNVTFAAPGGGSFTAISTDTYLVIVSTP